MFNYSKIMEPNTVVHCALEAEAEILLDWAGSKELSWSDGVSFSNKTMYERYEGDTCYCIKGGTFCSLDYYRGENYTIYEYSEVLEKEKNVLKDLYIKSHTVAKLNSILRDLFSLSISEKTLSKKDFGTNDEKQLSHTDEGNFFVGEIGNKIKLGKILSACTGLADYQIEAVVNEWKKLYEVSAHEIQISDDVSYVYRMNNVGNSCMAGKDEDWFEIYQDIGSRVVYIEEDGHLKARALLHDVTNIRTSMRVKVIDRIFFDNEIYKLALDKWAEENGYKQIYSASEHYVTSLVRTDYTATPYIDSLYLAVNYAGGIRLSNQHNVGRVKDRLQETGGGSEEGYICSGNEDNVYCEDTGNSRHIDDVHWVESEECYYEYTDDLIYIDSSGYYYYDSEYIAEDCVTGEWHLKEDMNETISNEWTQDGDYYEITQGMYEGYYTHIDNIYSLVDGDTCHADDEPTFIEGIEEYTLDTDDYYQHEDGLWYEYKEEEEIA